VSTRLCSLLGVEWKGFAAFAEEGSAAGTEARLEKFRRLASEVVEGEGGEPVRHPVKARPERHLFVLPGPSSSLRASRRLSQELPGQGFEVCVTLHAGECFDRGGTVVGTPVREVAALTEQAEPGRVLATEVFRLTVPVDFEARWERLDVPAQLAGTAWVLFELQGEEGG